MNPKFNIEELQKYLSKDFYVRSLGFKPFEWQHKVLISSSKRIILNAARQSGKSTITSSLPCHLAKHKSCSLAIVLAPTEKQASEDMVKIKNFIAMDLDFPKAKKFSNSEIELVNGSRIVVVPATETAARGYSCPDLVIIDEASRVEDIVFASGVKPMFTDNPDGVLVLLSTPAGKKGFFYDIWNNGSTSWLRIEVRSPFNPVSSIDGFALESFGDEQDFIADSAKKGIYACFSPRHRNLQEQQENLLEMGFLMYRQEYCCEFVETVDSVFSYDEIERMFSSKAERLKSGVVGDAPGLDFELELV